MNESIPVLRIGKYQPRYPLIQGGMGVDISGPNLAGHVAKCGAIGTIASVGLAHSSPLNGSNAGGYTYYNISLGEYRTSERLADKLLKHGSSDIEIGDNSVLQRTYSNY